MVCVNQCMQQNSAAVTPKSTVKGSLVIRTKSQSPNCSRRTALLASTVISLPLLKSQPSIAASSEAESPALEIFATSAPSVVAVGTLLNDNFTALASGVVWSSFGHVVTAYSPINNAIRQQQDLFLAIGQSPADLSYLPVESIVAREPSLDLIVLQSNLSTPSPVVVSPSSSLKVGQDLFLIGSTEDGSRTLSQGVLSATGRTIPSFNGQIIRNALQTDVDVTAFGLGGALVSSEGHLVGIPTVSYVKPGPFVRSSGVNFAVSSDILSDAVPKLIAYGNLAGRR